MTLLSPSAEYGQSRVDEGRVRLLEVWLVDYARGFHPWAYL